MSDLIDYDEDPRLCGTIETECSRCGATCRVDARHAGRDGVQPVTRYCRACEELGDEPPRSPCCGTHSLRGHQLHERMAWECEGCDTRYSLDVIRAYALGLAVERIVRESAASTTALDGGSLSVSGEHYYATKAALERDALILRAAAKLGVRH